MISERTRTVVLGVVTVVWAANFFAGIIISDYKPDQAINGIFMAIAGTLFALGNKNGGGGNNTAAGPNDAAADPPAEGEEP